MRLRDIVVVLSGAASNDVALETAIDIARRFDAHLSGFCPVELLIPSNFGLALTGYPGVVPLPEIIFQLEAGAREKAAGIEADFRERLRRHDVQGNWQSGIGQGARGLAYRARTADLLILGQPDPNQPSALAANRLLEDVLMTAGRPLLLIPFASRPETITTNILLGWNGSREAARAAHDALLLTEPGSRLTVLTIAPRSAGVPADLPGAQIAEHMARHGMNVSLTETVGGDGVSDADLLLNYAADIAADLLVVGGYGHSRTREVVLGGVTRELLAHMTIPVLMSH